MRISRWALTIFVGTALTPTAVGAQAQPAVVPNSVTAREFDASVQELVGSVNIPFETFTLSNGLRVVVHEDRKAPVVAVSVWYSVGSKDEPVGRTGFAHLFEHLMFNGSENAPGDYFQYTSAIGATDVNGTTWFDRTNYYQTVPTGALDRALFLESDRMGHLLGAVNQESLTNQIQVVQNEKRQSDNQPFGMVEYAELEALYPASHPYRHSTFGSMADLSAATLDAARDWFRANYGPNNAVLVLSGDLNTREARRLVERYFGSIPRGPQHVPAVADVPSLPQRVDRVMYDQVANSRLYRTWSVPGLTDNDTVPLSVGALVLGGLASSRLDNILVRDEQSAVMVAAGLQSFQRVGQFGIVVDVRNGQDVEAVSRRLDAIVADLVANGPTEDEVQRAIMRSLSNRVMGLEPVNGKATALAEGMLYANDPSFYQNRLRQLARVTPAQVHASMQRWLSRPVFALRVDPGPREEYQESSGAVASAPQPPSVAASAGTQLHVAQSRTAPPIAGASAIQLPAIERARLSNGIAIVYARRDTLPVTRVIVEFDAGNAADPAERLGTQRLMLRLMEDGTTSRDSRQIAEQRERLGASIAANAGQDRTSIALAALTPRLGPSLDLLADIVRNPAFQPREIDRVRQLQLAAISSELTDPAGLAARALPVALYGISHPYGRPGGAGNRSAVLAVTRGDLVRFHQTWIRPDNATIYAVGDLPLDRLLTQLEQRFGDWRVPTIPRGVKRFDVRIPQARPRILVIDRPRSPQSLILGGQVLHAEGTQDLFTLTAANEALGGGFLARMNMDLRERRGWSYGVQANVNLAEHQVRYVVQASVQSDRTADSIAALMDQMRTFLSSNGVQPAELDRIVQGNTRELAGRFQTSEALLSSMISNSLYRREDNYWEQIAGRFRGLTASQLDEAARRYIDPEKFVWVVVGDARSVLPQLDRLGLAIDIVSVP